MILDFSRQDKSKEILRRKLVHASLDVKLKQLFRERSGDSIWSSKAQSEGMFVDLSKVQWVDLGAAGRLVLILERAILDGLQVEVALPCREYRRSEIERISHYESRSRQQDAARIRRALERRRAAREYLQVMGFESVLHFPSKPEAAVVLHDHWDPNEGEDESSEEFDVTGGWEDDIPDHEPEELQNVFPLQWVPCNADVGGLARQMEPFWKARFKFEKVIGSLQRGISDFDAEAFANVVFHELLQNVRDHSHRDWALFGVWARKPWQPTIPGEYSESERRFFDNWIVPNDFPLVDIVFGDSGIGIPASLRESFEQVAPVSTRFPLLARNDDERMLFWAFDRWSSGDRTKVEVKRGTRGLYRVQRMVRGYRGQLSLRCGKNSAGWSFGGYDVEDPLCGPSNAAHQPGTFVAIRLPVIQKAQHFVKSTAGESRPLRIRFAPPLQITPHGISEDAQADLVRRMRGAATELVCLVGLIGATPTSIADRKAGIEQALRTIAILSNPGMFVLLDPTTPAGEVDTYADSVNQMIAEYIAQLSRNEGKSLGAFPENSEFEDPFLIVDRNYHLHAVGMPVENTILNQLQRDDAEETGLSRTRVLDILGDERHLEHWLHQLHGVFAFDPEGGVTLRFRADSIRERLLEAVTIRLMDYVQGLDPDGSRTAKNGLALLTPSLQFVKRWILPSAILREFGWFEYPSKASESPTQNRRFEPLGDLEFDSVGQLQEAIRTDFSRQKDYVTRRTNAKKDHLREDGPGYVIHALACKVAKYFEYDLPRIDYLIRDMSAPEDIALKLSNCLGIRDVIELPRQSIYQQIPEVWEQIEKKDVIVFCDILQSGATSQLILDQVARHKGRVLAVACIFDLRPKLDFELRPANGQPIRSAAEPIPVISLASDASLCVDEPEEWEVVDPATGQARPYEASPQLAYPLDRTKDLFPAIERTGALYFSHIIEPIGRHFTLYLDPKRLLSDDHLRAKTREAIDGEIRKFSDDVSRNAGKAETFVICIREEFEDQSLKDMMGSYWSPDRYGEVSQARNGIGLSKPPENVVGKDVVLIIWSAQSGSTVARIAFQLAEAGARSVLALIWLSRMDPEQEQVLRAYHTFNASRVRPKERLFDELRVDMASVRVSVRFLCSSQIPTHSLENCPICRQRERIRDEQPRYPIYIGPHIDRLVRASKPQTIEQYRRAAGTEPKITTPIGVTITPRQSTRILDFREILSDATYKTEVRWQVLTRLRKLMAGMESGDTDQRVEVTGVLHLLSAEIQLFKIPPLNYPELRSLLYNLARIVVLDAGSAYADVVSSIVVLRGSQKDRFANDLPEIASHLSAQHPEALRQLYYDAYTFVAQEYLRNEAMLAQMRQSLATITEHRKHELDSPAEKAALQKYLGPPGDTQMELLALVNTIYAEAEASLDAARVHYDDPATAWMRLRTFLTNQLANSHNVVPAAGRNLFVGFEGDYKPGRTVMNREFWASVEKQWGQMLVLFSREFVQPFRKIQDIFVKRSDEIYFDETERAWLADLAAEPRSRNFEAITTLLGLFRTDPPRFGSKEWERYVSLRNGFVRLVTQIPKIGVSEADDARPALQRFLLQCPVAIGDALGQARNGISFPDIAEWVADEGDLTTRAFCHEDLLLDVFKEAFDNAIVTHRSADRVKLSVRAALDVGGKRISVFILNTGTSAEVTNREMGAGSGQGLRRLARKLDLYGASLVPIPVSTVGWTFCLRLQLAVVKE